MPSLLIVLLLVWVVGIPLAIFLTAHAYSRYVGARNFHIRQRRKRFATQPRSVSRRDDLPVILVAHRDRQRRMEEQARETSVGDSGAEGPAGSLGSGRRRA